MELNCAEKKFKKEIANKYDDRLITNARVAHITEGTKPGLGRVTCQYRNRCRRGCPYGAYFSSNSSTLPAAEASGNMTLMPNSIVSQIIYDHKIIGQVGFGVIDSETNQVTEFNAKIIFLCASTIASTSILLQSVSDRFPNGLGNDSGELGHNLMDHHLEIRCSADIDGFEDTYYTGRRPGGIYIPRFVNIGGSSNVKDFVRGYGFQGSAKRGPNKGNGSDEAYGPNFKKIIQTPGPWKINLWFW